MSSPLSCPDAARLQQLLEDTLSPSEEADFSAHLQGCACCQRLLQELVVGKDSWAEASELLSREPQTGAAEPALQRVLDRLQGHSSGNDDTCDLSFLEPPSRPDSVGRLGPYDIQSVVGRGGMGIVLKAFDEGLHRVVAVKVMAPALAASAQARKRFIREAQAAAAVAHDHVVTIHAVQDGTLPYLVMQFVDGMSLEGKIERTGPLEVKEILRIGMQVAAGLAVAHAQGVVHRDIKPANILLENGIQRVKITDFGLARMVDAIGLTQSGVIAGTPEYMAPEQARGEALDHRADLFSLGSVLYAMCVGYAPFRASTNMAVLRRVCDEAPALVRELNPAIREELAEVIEKLHRKEPTARYQSAAVVADILGRQLAILQQDNGAPILMQRAFVRKKASPPATGRWIVPWLIGLLIAALVGGGSVWYFGFGPGRKEPPSDPKPPDAPALADVRTSPLVCSGHTEPITEVVFSPDGTTVASASDDKTIRLWNARTGEVRHVLQGDEHAIRGLAFSPRGDRLASVCTEGEVRLWDVTTGRQVDQFQGHTAELFAVAFSPDGKTLATGGRDRVIRLWDLSTRHERSLTEDEGVFFIRRLAFSPDGKTLASAGNQITFWDVPTGTRRQSIGFANTSALAYAPDGKTLAAASWKVGAIALLDPADGRQLAVWQAHDRYIESLDFSPDGKRLASAAADGQVRVWDPSQQRLRAQWQAHEGWIHGVSFSPDGKALATGGAAERKVKIWDLSRPGETTELPPQSEPLVSVPHKQTLKGHTASVTAVAFAPDSSSLASVSWDQTMRLWDTRTGELRQTLRGLQRSYQAVAFARDGQTLVSGGGGQDNVELVVWDVKTGERVGPLEGHQRGVFDVAISPDGKLVASAGWDRTVRVHDLATRKEVLTIEDKQEGLTRRVGFTNDGQTLFTCGTALNCYDSRSGESRLSVAPATGVMSDLKLSPRGDLFAATDWKGGKITLYGLDGKPRGNWPAHRDSLDSLAFSPNGQFLVSTSADGSAKVWDIATHQLRAILLGHRGAVYGVAFAPDGQTVATTGSEDGLVLLWDVSALRAGPMPP